MADATPVVTGWKATWNSTDSNDFPPWLMGRTAFENIALGMPVIDCDRAYEFEPSCVRSCADPAIAAAPSGVYTICNMEAEARRRPVCTMWPSDAVGTNQEKCEFANALDDGNTYV
jgi:hypothetical protein